MLALALMAVPAIFMIMAGGEVRKALALGFAVGMAMVMLDRELVSRKAARNKPVEKPE